VKILFVKNSGSTQSAFRRRIFLKNGTAPTVRNNARKQKASFPAAIYSIRKVLMFDFIQQFECKYRSLSLLLFIIDMPAQLPDVDTIVFLHTTN